MHLFLLSHAFALALASGETAISSSFCLANPYTFFKTQLSGSSLTHLPLERLLSLARSLLLCHFCHLECSPGLTVYACGFPHGSSMGLVLRKHSLAKQNFPLQKSREPPVVLRYGSHRHFSSDLMFQEMVGHGPAQCSPNRAQRRGGAVVLESSGFGEPEEGRGPDDRKRGRRSPAPLPSLWHRGCLLPSHSVRITGGPGILPFPPPF